jgi:autotransporter-associated beta strand protein
MDVLTAAMAVHSMKTLYPLLLGVALLATTNARGLTLYFWDTNGTGAGCGSEAPTGTWGVDAFWNTNGAGVGTGTVAWPAGQIAVFCAGDDAVGAYTVHVKGVVQVGDIHVDLGAVTFDPDPESGGSLNLLGDPDDGADRKLSVGHKDPNTYARYNVVLSGATNIIRYKYGTLVLGATNTYKGSTTIEGGVVQLGVPGAIPVGSDLILGNGDGRSSDGYVDTPATFNTGGFDQALGMLVLTGPNMFIPRTIDFGNGEGTLAFADSSSQTWQTSNNASNAANPGPITLTLTHYSLGKTKLRFGTSSAGLASTQLSQISFTDYANLPGVIDGSGYVTPALPKIIGITPPGASVELVWTAVNGRTYRVWTRDSLTAGSWTYASDVTATGDTGSYTDWAPSATGRFYRVEALPF